MRLFLISFLMLITFTSCDAVMFVVMGIKSPKPETTKSLLTYEKKVGYNPDKNNFFIDSSRIEKTLSGAFPKGFIYDKNGNTVAFLDCFHESLSQLSYFFKLPLDSRKSVSDTLHILLGQDTLLHIAPKFSEIVQFSNVIQGDTTLVKPETEYYVVYFWSKSFGRINKKYGSKMEAYIEEHPEFNASFIKINCDYRKDWGYTKKQLRTEWK